MLADEFTELANELSLIGPDGIVCVIEDEHHDDNETEHEEEHRHELTSPLNLTCENTFAFVGWLLVRLNLTRECCLENVTACEEEMPTEPVPTLSGVSEGEPQLLAAFNNRLNVVTSQGCHG